MEWAMSGRPDPESEAFGAALGAAFAEAWRVRQERKGISPSLIDLAVQRGMLSNPDQSGYGGLPLPSSSADIPTLPPPSGMGNYPSIYVEERRNRGNNGRRVVALGAIATVVALGVTEVMFHPLQNMMTKPETTSAVKPTSMNMVPFNPQTTVNEETVTGSTIDPPPVVIGLNTHGPFQIPYLVPIKGKNKVYYITKDANNIDFNYTFSLGEEARLASVADGKPWFTVSEKDGTTTYTIDRSKFSVQVDPNINHGTSSVVDPTKTDDPNTPEQENVRHYNADGTEDVWSMTAFSDANNILIDPQVTEAEKERVAKVVSMPLLLEMMVAFRASGLVQFNECQSPGSAKPTDQLSSAFDTSIRDRFAALGARYGRNIAVKFKDGSDYVINIVEDLKRQDVIKGMTEAKIEPYYVPNATVGCTITYVKNSEIKENK